MRYNATKRVTTYANLWNGQTFGRIVALAFFAILMTTGAAQAALTLSNDCDAELTTGDRAALMAAYNFVYDHQQDMYDEVIKVTADGNIHNYDDISASEFYYWKKALQSMEDGDIKLRCHYNSTAGELPFSGNRYCNNNPGVFGRTWDLYIVEGDIRMCIENISDHTGNEDEFIAAMAGTIAHELMHHADGVEDHPTHDKCGYEVEKGFSDPACPADAAQTAGVAMENLALSPQFQASISGVDITATNDSSYEVSVDASISNSNPYAGTNSSTAINSGGGASTAFRNGYSYACLFVDGVEVGRNLINRMNGATSETTTFEFEVDVVSDGAYHNMEVLADCDEDLYEWDEYDNLSSDHDLELTMDLDVDVQLAAAPRVIKAFPSTTKGFGFGGGKSAWKKSAFWYWEVDYLVTVQNNGGVTSPVSELTFTQENHIWAKPYITADTTLPRLASGDETSFVTTVYVRANSSITAPSPATDVSWEIDADHNEIFDSAFSNNAVAFSIDADYWRPDYTPTEIEVRNVFSSSSNPFGSFSHPSFGSGSSSTYGSTVTISLRVGNFGPVEPSETATVAIYDEDGILLEELPLDPVAVVEESDELTFEVEGPSNLCDTRLYSLVIDSDDDISENDESNNIVVITVGGCPKIEESLDLQFDMDRYFSPIDMDKYLTQSMKFLELLQEDPMDLIEFIKHLALSGSNGPFLPMDEAVVYDLRIQATDSGMLYTTMWLNTAQDASQMEMLDTLFLNDVQGKAMYKSL